MARRNALTRAIKEYRAELGNVSLEALAELLGTSRPALGEMMARGYCTPRLARRFEKNSKGRLPAWMTLGLADPPPPPKREARRPEAR